MNILQNQPLVYRLAAIAVCLSVGIYGLYLLQEIFKLLLFSLLIAMLLLPLCRRIEAWRVPRGWAILLCILLFLGILVGMISLVSVQVASLTEDLPRLEEKLGNTVENAQALAKKYLRMSASRQKSELRKLAGDALKNSGSYASNFIGSLANLLTNLSLVPLFVFFILLYRDFFRQFLYKLFARTRRGRIDDLLRKINGVVQSYLVGLLLVIGIVAVLNTIGLLFLGIDYAWFFGLLCAFLLLVPYIGILVGSILPMVYALITKDSPMYALGVGGVFGLVQILEGNFITPNIVGSKVSVNPLAAMLALLLFGQLWGVGGLILALPITAIVKVICDHIEPLKAFGFLLGDSEKAVRKPRKIRFIKKKQ